MERRTRRASVVGEAPMAAESAATPSPTPAASQSSSSFRAGAAASWWSQLSKLNANELRHVYFTQYRVGSYADFVSAGDASKYRVPDPLTILFYGPSGAGKSSLINTFKRVIEDEIDWNPVAPVNDEEVARATRTVQTRCYQMGVGRARELGRVELWDTRGCWFPGHVDKDFANICDYKSGRLGPGDVVANVRDELSHGKTADMVRDPLQRPVGDTRPRAVDLIVFVLDPSSGHRDQEHLRDLLKLMHKAEFTYSLVLTKPDDYFHAWSNVDEAARPKLSHVSVDETWCVENYKYSKSKRLREQDRNVLYVWLKLLMAAERALLSEPAHPFASRRARSELVALGVALSVLLTVALLLAALFR